MITNPSVIDCSKQARTVVLQYVKNCLTNGLSRTGTQVSDVRTTMRNKQCKVFETCPVKCLKHRI